MRVGDGPAWVEGSTKTKCDDCGCECWISPATKRMAEEVKPEKTLCINCGLAHFEKVQARAENRQVV